MANRVVIDVEARFVDKVTSGMNSASRSVGKLGKDVDSLNKKLDQLNTKGRYKTKIDADDSKFTKKIRDAQSKAEKLGKTKAVVALKALDKASTTIGKVTGAAKSFAGKSFKATLWATDKASSIINSVSGAARSFAGRTWSAAIKVKDYALAPLTKIKNMLFNIKTLIGAIAAGWAAQKVFAQPVGLADAYSGAKIGFSTLLGDTEGQAMMDKLDDFAKATPFKTSGVIDNAQKMMAMGWDPNQIIDDMKIIGDAAAATGKMDQGLESIVRALAQIKTKGKLSTEELNQLSEAGIAAKAMLAEQLGYGTGDEGIAKMAQDLEKGLIGSEVAVQALLQGMKQFEGTMERTANETVEGLKSQLADTFEINVLRKWGQGLQDGAKRGFGTILDLLDNAEDSLTNFGDMVYEIGKSISNWAADKLEKSIERIKEITGTDVFKEADLGTKIKLLWDGVVADPLAEWWENGGQEKTANTAEKIGKWMGETLHKAIMGLLGITDLLTDDGGKGEDAGMSVAQSFAKGFAEGFDASVVTDKLVEAVKNVWGALPGWAKFLIGSYAVGKVSGGINSILTLGSNLVGGAAKAIGGFGIANTALPHLTSAGTGLAGIAGKTGVALGASTTGGALLAGGASIAGGVMGGVALGKGIYDVYGAIKAHKAGDKTEENAKMASGASAIGGVATGAAIGSLLGPVGALVGAGIGGVVGLVGGSKWAKSIRKEAEAAKYETEEMKAAIQDTEMSAEELAMQLEIASKKKLAERFGEIELSMEEINRLAKNTVFGDHVKTMEKFATASQTAEQSLQAFNTAAADMERLNFDMAERTWKMEFGLEEKLSEEEIEQVKARVQTFIESAEKVLSDQHYKFNAAVEVLLNPVEGEENTLYDQFITDGNNMYAKLQKQLDEHTENLTAKYNLYLEDGKISANEQKILSEIQGEIAEIMKKVSNAETEASFEVSKLKFTTGDLSAESFQTFQASLQEQLANYQAEQEEALTVAISEINLELKEEEITEDQYKDKLKKLVEDYNTNIDTMTANVNSVQLEGISEAFNDVATAEEIQAAINGCLESGENPLELTFDDINAHLKLKEDALSEEDKAAFVDVMQEAIKSAASGENALKTTAEVDPTFTTSEGANINEELSSYLSEQLAGSEEGTTITPDINVDPTPKFAEGAGETMKSEVETQVSSYLTGENSINTDANVYAAAKMYGAEGIPLSEEAAKGRSSVKSSIDTAFTDPFSASADANITLNWKISNPTTTLSFSGGGGSGSTVTATVGGNAAGGIITGGPQLSWLDEENMGEAVIPFNPSRRSRALQLFAETGRRLGVLNHANGGIIGGDSEPIRPFEGDVKSGGKENKIEINMGGVTIEIKADGNKSMVQNIEEQQEEIAQKVAEIFNRTFKAQFANTPLKGGA